jgi:FkbM family methyltransferase
MDFESKLEAFYRQLGTHIEAGDVIDVGAHTGRHAIPLARLAGPSGLVWAFEPLPPMRQQLVANAASAEVNNIVLLPFAVGEADSLAEFTYVPSSPEESGLRERGQYNVAPDVLVKLPVAVKRLDNLIHTSRKVVFVKIDVEGGEADVVKGAELLISRSRPIIAFECGAAAYQNYPDTPKTLWYSLSSKGYHLHAITGPRMHSYQEFVEATVTQAFWDYIALPAEHADKAALL